MQTDLANAVTGGYAVDESRLVDGARVRSPEAWALIYDRHYEAIYRYVRARVFDADTAVTCCLSRSRSFRAEARLYRRASNFSSRANLQKTEKPPDGRLLGATGGVSQEIANVTEMLANTWTTRFWLSI
jgi:hypothetical protein